MMNILTCWLILNNAKGGWIFRYPVRNQILYIRLIIIVMAEEKPLKDKAEMVSNHLKKENDTYDPVFVAKILEGEKAKNTGEKGLSLDVENMWETKPEIKSDKLPAHILKSIEIGIKQYENGQAISFKEFKKRHFSKK